MTWECDMEERSRDVVSLTSLDHFVAELSASLRLAL